MGVVYIGDRATGKTSLAAELTNPQCEYVEIGNQGYDHLRSLLYDEYSQDYRPTDIHPTEIYTARPLDIRVQLPAGMKKVHVDWIDTPGELWRKSWQKENALQWQKVLATIQKSEGILLVLPPYRTIKGLNPSVNSEAFPTLTQWHRRFCRWADFFIQDCPKARQVVICLNKADLFCDVYKEAEELGYHPYKSRKNWFDRNVYVSQKYFAPIGEQILNIQQHTNLSVRCFITSIHHRSLLELPWIYLASHL